MAKAFTPQIVTANDLLDGDVVYLTGDGSWMRRPAGAAIARTVVQAQMLLSRAAAQSNRVVDPYLAAVSISPRGQPVPVHFREQFRARGPSNRPDHGKQAENDYVSL